MDKKTKGEELVRVDFNPSKSDKVTDLKQKFASLINEVDSLSNKDTARHVSLAITNLETAAMFAVKAITYKP